MKILVIVNNDKFFFDNDDSDNDDSDDKYSDDHHSRQQVSPFTGSCFTSPTTLRKTVLIIVSHQQSHYE